MELDARIAEMRRKMTTLQDKTETKKGGKAAKNENWNDTDTEECCKRKTEGEKQTQKEGGEITQHIQLEAGTDATRHRGKDDTGSKVLTGGKRESQKKAEAHT